MGGIKPREKSLIKSQNQSKVSSSTKVDGKERQNTLRSGKTPKKNLKKLFDLVATPKTVLTNDSNAKLTSEPQKFDKARYTMDFFENRVNSLPVSNDLSPFTINIDQLLTQISNDSLRKTDTDNRFSQSLKFNSSQLYTKSSDDTNLGGIYDNKKKIHKKDGNTQILKECLSLNNSNKSKTLNSKMLRNVDQSKTNPSDFMSNPSEFMIKSNNSTPKILNFQKKDKNSALNISESNLKSTSASKSHLKSNEKVHKNKTSEKIINDSFDYSQTLTLPTQNEDKSEDFIKLKIQESEVILQRSLVSKKTLSVLYSINE